MGAVESVDQKEKKDAIQTRACICYPRRRCSHVAFKSWPGSVSHRYTTLVRSHTRCRTVSHWDGRGGGRGQGKRYVESEAIISYYYYSRFRREPWRF